MSDNRMLPFSIHSDKPSEKTFFRFISHVFFGWHAAYQDITSGLLNPIQQAEKASRLGLPVIISLIFFWFIYVPIHELLHVAGCVFSGGTVSELIMGKEYGADFLQKIFPFIVPQSSAYAGRVTGFDPNGDLGYFLTVFCPFTLTILPGVWLFLQAARHKTMWLMGPGIILGFTPFLNLTGDYFEMGTIFSTRIINFMADGRPASLYPKYWDLRSDDIFRLIGELGTDPTAYGFQTPGGFISVISVILMGAVLSVLFAGWTYGVGRKIADLLQQTRNEEMH